MSAPAVSRTVIVTGGSAGLGRAIAVGLLEAGHRLIVMGRNEPRLAEFSAEAAGRGWSDRTLTVRGDVRDEADCVQAIDATTAAFGAVDVLINNAAFHLDETSRKFYDIATSEWRISFDTNVIGPFLMARAAVPQMIARGWGRIINHETTYRTMLRGGMSAYGSSKAALEAATVSWAADLAGTGVTVNAILPGGAADVPRLASHAFPDRSKLVPPAALVPPVRWLVSDAADDISGIRVIANRWDPTHDVATNVVSAVEPAGWAAANS